MSKKYQKILVPAVYVAVVASLMTGVILVLSSVSNYLNVGMNYKYTLDNVFDDTVPVINIQTNNETIIRPYISETVDISKYFYDVESNIEEQESSIIYYQNTYIQNSGVDYTSEEDFDVVSILDGEVLSVEDSEIYGKIVTIKHNDNLVTVYSSLTDVLVNKGYKVAQGEIIASSMKSELNDKNSTLHFEVYYKNDALDPENLYDLSIKDFR